MSEPIPARRATPHSRHGSAHSASTSPDLQDGNLLLSDPNELRDVVARVCRQQSQLAESVIDKLAIAGCHTLADLLSLTEGSESEAKEAIDGIHRGFFPPLNEAPAGLLLARKLVLELNKVRQEHQGEMLLLGNMMVWSGCNCQFLMPLLIDPRVQARATGAI